jgi:hypothetical protein
MPGPRIGRTEATLQAEMFLVGCAYNFWWEHESLRLAAPDGAGRKWQERMPARAAGLTDHRWRLRELLSYQVLWPPGWRPDDEGGRPSRSAKKGWGRHDHGYLWCYQAGLVHPKTLLIASACTDG